MIYLDPRAITKTGDHTAVSEASTLGFAVGKWPKKVSLGLFELTLIRLEETGGKYLEPKSGSVLFVVND